MLYVDTSRTSTSVKREDETGVVLHSLQGPMLEVNKTKITKRRSTTRSNMTGELFCTFDDLIKALIIRIIVTIAKIAAMNVVASAFVILPTRATMR